MTRDRRSAPQDAPSFVWEALDAQGHVAVTPRSNDTQVETEGTAADHGNRLEPGTRRASGRVLVVTATLVLLVGGAYAFVAHPASHDESAIAPVNLPQAPDVVAPASSIAASRTSTDPDAGARVSPSLKASPATPGNKIGKSTVGPTKAPSSAATTPAAHPATSAKPTISYPTAAPGVDLASGRPATASSVMQNYVASNITDGNVDTYWESDDAAGLPQQLTVDLGEVTTVGTFGFHLPQQSDWNERTETFTILGSTNGTDFFTIEPSAVYTFNANSASRDSSSAAVNPVHVRYVRLYFTATAGWPAAQMGELDVYS